MIATIPLTKPYWGKEEADMLLRAFQTTTGVGDGPYSRKLSGRLERLLTVGHAFPVTSCTHALELAMRALGVGAGDEVILPSFTMTSTANCVVLAGAVPVFVDIDPVTYCIDPDDVEMTITHKTRGIVVVHYAGMACDMEKLGHIARKHKLFIVEDAAHAIGAKYLGKPLGTLGAAGAFSFHGTKNVSCGEGGALVTNDPILAKKIGIFRANGTNRNDFIKGLVAKYHWIGAGSSYFLSDLLASLVLVQLTKLRVINAARRKIAASYANAFSQFSGKIQLPTVSKGTNPNWHIYAIKLPTIAARQRFVEAMRAAGIEVSLHYVPLHSSPMGKRVNGNKRKLPITEDVAATLVRLPIYPGLTERELEYITTTARRILKKI
mgnify:CR=1 FL=1